jgi:hypothetical protein
MPIHRRIWHGARWLVLDLRAYPYVLVSACGHRLLYVALAHHACTPRYRVGWMDGAAPSDTHGADLLVGATSPDADAKGGIDFSSGGIPSYPFPFPLLPFALMFCSSAQPLRPRGTHAKGEFGLGAIEVDTGEVRLFYISVFFGREFRVSCPFHASSKSFGRAPSVVGGDTRRAPVSTCRRCPRLTSAHRRL